MNRLFENFLNSKHKFPVLAAIAAGLYPLLFYYSRNFTLIDSWSHLAFFVGLFLLLPILVFIFFHWLSKQSFASRWEKYILPFLNILVFLLLLKVILYPGMQKKLIFGIVIISAGITFFLHKHFKKWMLFQLLLAVIGLVTFAPALIKILSYSDNWSMQTDSIEQVIFKQKPNVYFIQPDGYVNFSELKKGYYKFDNTQFENFLIQNNFKNYENFRSNYDATLTSNSSIFMMKHHFYAGSTNSSEVTGARKIIVGDNAVLDIFKNNGYKTYLFMEFPYLLMNRPKIGYDFSNFEYSEVPLLGSGLETKKEILSDLKSILERPKVEEPKFFFIEIFNPKHIDGSSGGDNIVEEKRQIYLQNLNDANRSLQKIVTLIIENDPSALIMITADHGGYVGMDRLQQGNIKTEDRDKIFSIFSSVLSIRWPNGKVPEFDTKLKSSVNVFRILFSYLSENTVYLENLEKDASYGAILKGAPEGIYQLIDENGNPVFREIDN